MENNKNSRRDKTKKDVRLQVFITSRMDDELEDISYTMGMTKQEFTRYAIGQAMAGYKGAMQILREKANEELEVSQLDGQIYFNNNMDFKCVNKSVK